MKKNCFILFLLIVSISLIFFVIPVHTSSADETILKIIPSNRINKKSFIKSFDKNSQSYLIFTDNYLFKTANNEEEIKQIFTNQLKTTNNTLINTPIPSNSLMQVKSRSSGNRTWYTYQQTISGIPVFGSQFTVHLKENEVYSISSSYLTNTALPVSRITKAETEEIAINQAKKDYPNITSFTISSSENIVYNSHLLGLNENDQNHLAQKITAVSTSIVPIGSTYFVDLSNGEILLVTPLLKNTLNRTIFNCSEYNKTRQSCNTRRTEGSPPVVPTISITQNQANDINNTYMYLGNIYNFYFNSFERDSYDNQGSPLKSFVNIKTGMVPGFPCPNAAWSSGDNKMYLCEGIVGNDVIAHELTHAVTDHEINLMYVNQSGAISESLSDIFAYGVDSNDWTMGEDTILGVIRHIDNPTLDDSPDRLFSSYYYCEDIDYGGVHTNNSIISKAFYLMVQGGDFNGCTLTPIGKEKALLLFYSTIVSGHIQYDANFYSLYTALNQTCNELRQDGVFSPSDCIHVDRALQSVEIDQQTPESQKGPLCEKIPRKTPLCVQTDQATTTPTPTTIQILGCTCLGSSKICSQTCKDKANESISGYSCATADSNCSASYARTKGDSSGDGKTCLNDYTELVQSSLGKYNSNLEQLLYSDFNGDGIVDDQDRSKFIENYIPDLCETSF